MKNHLVSRNLYLICASVLVFTTVALFSPAQTTDAVGTSRSELQQGVAAFKAQRYEQAAAHFQRSAELDPKLVNARLYLATTYAQMYVPGAETADNNANAERAIAEYRRVLEADPTNISSIKGIAYLYMNMRNWEEAKNYYLRATEADPADAEAYYSAGVIDWTMSYKFRMDARSKAGLPTVVDPWGEFRKSFCPSVRAENWNRVAHGIDMFDRALKLRPDYDDAMAYMNLMFRERAEMQCNDKAAHDADVRTADKWVNKTMATKKAKDEREKPQQ